MQQLFVSIEQQGSKMAENKVITGRAKGGIARKAALSPERRKQIASEAAAARWAGPIKNATHGSAEKPLKIGSITIPCYVLEGEIRVLSQRGLQTGIGMSTSGGSGGAQRMAQFIQSLADKGIDTKDLVARISNPILFRPTGGGKPAYGYEATIINDICDAVLAARKGGKLQKQQSKFAEQCELLTQGLARTGIIGLVDEVTGYQLVRADDALAKILEQYIAKELQPYIPTFDSKYYEQMFRLRGLKYPTEHVKRPQYFGILTNEIVYRRLAPGVLDELRAVTPRLGSGRLSHKLFQRLTKTRGYPKLKEHLGAVVTMMQLSDDWHDFMKKLDRLRPRLALPRGKPSPQLSFDYDAAADSGKGI